jgi:single stranded DNA-binding protein (ssb)
MKIHGIGRIASDIEMKATAKGTQVCSFRIACDRKFKVEGQPDADFFDCTAFGKTGETIAKYFTKGVKIYINGTPQINSWTNQTDGTKRSRMIIIVDEFEFCEKAGTSNIQNTSTQNSSFFDNTPNDEDDLF